jgi:hypothetical protein
MSYDELVKSPICPIIVIPVLARRSASARRRENGNPVFLNGSLLSQGHRLDSGFLRSDVFLSFYETISYDTLVKSRKRLVIVIPAKAGIQCFQMLIKILDTGFHL